METDTIEYLRGRSAVLLTTLKEHPRLEDTWQATVSFSGYTSLLCTVQDLMKLCTLALLSEEPYLSPVIGNTSIDIAAIMELAIQLMPREETEFLDEFREAMQRPPSLPVPEYNYSTVRILDVG